MISQEQRGIDIPGTSTMEHAFVGGRLLTSRYRHTTMPNRLTLQGQCALVGWPVRRLSAVKAGTRQWSRGSLGNASPEQVVAAYIEGTGAQCCWCEGGSVNLLIKAAALDILSKRNIFRDREDAVRRYLEAQLALLSEHKSEVLAHIREITLSKLNRNIGELMSDEFIREAYPRATEQFIRSLAEKLGNNFIAKIAELFFAKPYEYRAGWPDLTVIGEDVNFVEVKTTDLLHKSQIRFANELAVPLRLRCEVIQVCEG